MSNPEVRKMKCECGANINPKYILVHKRTKKHKLFENEPSNIQIMQGKFLVSFK